MSAGWRAFDPASMIGKEIGNLRIVRLIGEGGMGAVYLAQHTAISRKVAVKVLRPEMGVHPQIIERFFNEARAANAIGHPGIIDIIDLGVLADAWPYLIMEFLQGESLASRLHRAGRLTVAEALDVTHQTAAAIGAAHAKGIVHRDLKPANLFLVQDRALPGRERIKVLDFGVAKLTGHLRSGVPTHSGVVVGTPAYMSPEQCLGTQHEVDHCSDIYSLGCILYEMLVGEPPFFGLGPGEMIISHVTHPPRPPGQRVPGIPPHIERAVLKALAKRPEDRFRSMADLQNGLLERTTQTIADTGSRDDRDDSGPHRGPGDFARRYTPAPPPGHSEGPLTQVLADGGPMTPPRPRTPGAGVASPGALVASSPTVAVPTPATPPPPRSSRGTRALAPVLLLVGAVGGGLWWSTRHLVPPRAPPVPAPGEVSGAEEGTTLIDAAERLARTRRYEAALALLTRAGEVKVKSADLLVRMARLRETLAAADLVKKARTHLEERRYQAAVDNAQRAHELDPENTDAVDIIASARGAQQQLQLGALRGKSKEHARRRPPASTAPGKAVSLNLPISSDGSTTGGSPPRPGDQAREDRAESPPPAADSPPSSQARRPPPRPPGTPAPASTAGSAPASAVNAMPSPPVRPSLPPPSGPVFSGARPDVFKPTLPRVFVAQAPEPLRRVLEMVEAAVVAQGGVSPEFARGATSHLKRQVGPSTRIYPVAIFYFIIREAALGHDSNTAASALASAQASGVILKLKDFPANEPRP